MRTRKTSDRALLEGLVSKYGKDKILDKINKLNENMSNTPVVALLPADSLDFEWDFDPINMEPSEFLKLAKQYGTVKRLDAFERMWNAAETSINNNDYYIRIIF